MRTGKWEFYNVPKVGLLDCYIDMLTIAMTVMLLTTNCCNYRHHAELLLLYLTHVNRRCESSAATVKGRAERGNELVRAGIH